MKIKTLYITGIAALLFFTGCEGKKNQEVILGPEETAEAFWRAVAGGDFDEAATLCDTTSMKGFIGNYRDRWEKTVHADSAAAVIAAGLLSSAEMTIVKNVKEGDARKIIFSIRTGMGMEKEKSAIVKKDEGVWKVVEMTDAI